ncbi:hypothetical protein [Mycoplasmopsis agassizii]|uniref:Lipoprotein n=1 Tax=Mycoplasmopsis agassizii TaxID=33922 RepID=A0ABX4H482_9BACT|nr:hypothetical protein [Mycoplasmopsis agassizii]PAF54696.1 hypothetical protein CJF60_03075 [Mycoplasmopsis agassizii]SMC15997.1 hypothetical protein SAMN02745179_00187 [Mycoplasmopsis agassizii]
MKKINKKSFLFLGIAVVSVAAISAAVACTNENEKVQKANKTYLELISKQMYNKYNLVGTYADQAALKTAVEAISSDSATNKLEKLVAFIDPLYKDDFVKLVGQAVIAKLDVEIPKAPTGDGVTEADKTNAANRVDVVLHLEKGKKDDSTLAEVKSKAIQMYVTPQKFLDSLTFPKDGYKAASTIPNRADFQTKAKALAGADLFEGLAGLLDKDTPFSAKALDLVPKTTLTTIVVADGSATTKTKLTLTFKQGTLTTTKDVEVTTKA